MWVAQPPRQMTADEYFVYRVQLVTAQYGVDVEIDVKNRVVKFQTDDEMLIRTIENELEEFK